MKLQSGGKYLFAGALTAAWVVLGAVAQEAKPTASEPSPTATPATADKAPAIPAGSGIADVLKMLDAGVSKDVVKAYIASAPGGFKITAADLIALKQRGVPDDVAMDLLNRTGPARPMAMRADGPPPRPAAAAPAPDRAPPPAQINSGYVDPESYSYFQRYYLYPRTLANVYQTLGYPGYGYGPGVYFGGGFGPRRGFIRINGPVFSPGW